MSYIADKTAGQNGRKFFVDTQGFPEGVYALKNRFKKNPQATPGPSANNI